MDEVRKKSLKEVLPKKDSNLASRKNVPVKRAKLDMVLDDDTLETAGSKNYYQTKKSSLPRISYFVWICLALVLVVGIYSLSTLFASVTIKLTPRQLAANIEGTFEANRAPAEGIEFSVIKLEETTSKEVPASGQTKVQTKATGVVTITNNFSTASQKLVAGTRLESSSGLIYKLDSTVTVPGQTKKGTIITPGSIAVKVTASETGEGYNIGSANLKIVGFKGTPRYDKFVVKTKTNIAGGKEGLVSNVKDEDRQKAVAEMQTELKEKVTKKALSQIPKDFIIFDDGIITSFSDEIISGEASSTVKISTKVTMIALLFNTKNVSKYFADKQIKDESTEGIKIANIEKLVFQMQEKEKFDFEKTNKIKFTLTGKANLVWAVDVNDLKSKLVNTKIKAKDQVFASYPAIHRAEAVVRPPWVLSFPQNQDKINVKLIIQE